MKVHPGIFSLYCCVYIVCFRKSNNLIRHCCTWINLVMMLPSSFLFNEPFFFFF